MEVLHPRCAGLDVHSRCVNACVRIVAGRKVTTEHREFATTTAGLLELAAWLTEAGCTHVAMEATGVVFHLPQTVRGTRRLGRGKATGLRGRGRSMTGGRRPANSAARDPSRSRCRCLSPWIVVDRHRPTGVLEVDPELDRERRSASERQFQNCLRGESYGARAVRCG